MSIKAQLKKATGIWQLRGTYLGVNVDRSAGTRSKEHADILAAKEEAEIFERFVKGPTQTATFSEAATDYLNAGGEAVYMKRLVERFGPMKMAQIDQSMLDKAAIELYPNAKSSTRRRHVYSPFIACWRRAEVSQKAPVRRWIRAAEGKRRTKWLTPEEAEKLIAALAPPTAALVTFYLGVGCRASEALDLVWSDISPAAQRVTFWEDITKAGESRSVDLCQRVRDALPQRRGPDDPVFLNTRGQPWHSYDAINLAIKAACKRAGIRHVSCHALRHTFATWGYAQTRNLERLMLQGGWATAEMCMRYMHAASDDVAASVAAHGWAILGWTPPQEAEKLKAIK